MVKILVNGNLASLVSDQTDHGHGFDRVQGRQCRSCGSGVAYWNGQFFCTGGCGEIDEADVVREEEALTA